MTPAAAPEAGERGPSVYSVAAHRGFADALVAGLVPRYAEPELGLARLTLLLPSRRAARTVTEAFVRHAGATGAAGQLLPRMAVVGDLDLDEALGALLDPLGAGGEVPPAVDPTWRWLRLARIYGEVRGEAGETMPGEMVPGEMVPGEMVPGEMVPGEMVPGETVPGEMVPGATRLRHAFALGQTIDRLQVEGIELEGLLDQRIAAIVGDQAEHWANASRDFARVLATWRAELAARGEVDPPARRNALFERAAARWRRAPPPHAIVAAGVTSASPALARLLRVVAELPRGSVVLPDLDLELDDAVWAALGVAGAPAMPDEPPFAPDDAITHPQYHLKLLLNRMCVNRHEVRAWHRSGPAASSPGRARAISDLFLPPSQSGRWVELSPERRRLKGVRLMETAHPGEEAQAIAILVRQALEMPERRVAVVTPDRGLAARIAAHLKRWEIDADDSAGLPLPQTAPARVLLLLAEVIAQDAAPVPLLALLTHPLVAAGERRAAWLEQARAFDRALRGPRPAPGLAPLALLAASRRLGDWWSGVEAVLAPLLGFAAAGAPLADLLDALSVAGEALCGEEMWSGADGRALAGFVDGLRGASRSAGTMLAPVELAPVLREAMDRIAVRPPWGGHPRVAIYGLLEARMSRADLVICGGLVEGVWPGRAAPDALLPPAVLRALGVPGAEFRIGLAAHDLAAALGAPEVVLSWARRDAAGPVIPSRFVLRVKAMLGERLAGEHADVATVDLALRIDRRRPAPPYPRPEPRPSAAQRAVPISVTGLDRLRGDPYQFYADAILGLKRLEHRDVAPTPAWKGTAAHAILKRWHDAGEPPGALLAIAATELDTMSGHPLTRALWRPRLLAALGWINAQVAALKAAGRTVAAAEVPAEMRFKGVRIHGRADRVDRLADGRLAIVDYKTGTPPSGRRVAEGFALQLGVIGLIAAEGGIAGVRGEPERFEYWSLGRNQTEGSSPGFGYSCEPILEGRRKTGIVRDRFLPTTREFLADAIDRWILGDAPFTARLNPDLRDFNDYDQLMRLDEWQTRLGGEAAP